MVSILEVGDDATCAVFNYILIPRYRGNLCVRNGSSLSVYLYYETRILFYVVDIVLICALTAGIAYANKQIEAIL